MTDEALAVLEHTHATPSTIGAIADETHLPRRAVEAAIQELRLAGWPLITDAAGVRIAQDAADLERCAAALRRRIATQYVTFRALRDTARTLRARDDGASQLEMPF